MTQELSLWVQIIVGLVAIVTGLAAAVKWGLPLVGRALRWARVHTIDRVRDYFAAPRREIEELRVTLQGLVDEHEEGQHADAHLIAAYREYTDNVAALALRVKEMSDRFASFEHLAAVSRQDGAAVREWVARLHTTSDGHTGASVKSMAEVMERVDALVAQLTEMQHRLARIMDTPPAGTERIHEPSTLRHEPRE